MLHRHVTQIPCTAVCYRSELVDRQRNAFSSGVLLFPVHKTLSVWYSFSSEFLYWAIYKVRFKQSCFFFFLQRVKLNSLSLESLKLCQAQGFSRTD